MNSSEPLEKVQNRQTLYPGFHPAIDGSFLGSYKDRQESAWKFGKSPTFAGLSLTAGETDLPEESST